MWSLKNKAAAGILSSPHRSNVSTATPFAVFTELDGGGKVIAMGEGMASLYMTSWQGVENYECAGFMGDMIGWLLE